MTLLIDYSAARPAPAVIKAVGYSGVMRYLSNDPKKNLQPAERDALLAAGLSIGLVWETTAARAADGFAAGAADAKTAEAQAAALGFPAGLPIFYAVDFAAASSVVKPYFDGVRSVAKRPVGIYGSLSVVDAALAGGWASYAWQSCAWSGSLVSQRAHLYQRMKATVANPISGTDENVVLRPFPLWTASSSTAASDVPPVFTKPAPAPAPKPAPAPPKGLTVQTIDLRNADRVTVKGPGVKPLQRLLGVTADGLAGRNTKAALHAFQLRAFGHADDIFGPQSAEALLAGK
jgi:peptidoglycan hydrolase-like protein with peptidoglycan-binding domain